MQLSNRKALFKLTLRLLFMVSGLLCCSPVQALDPSRNLTQYALDVWRAEQGLPSNTVSSIIQTRDGYLWLGTQSGLVRFDGVRVTIFASPDTEGINENRIWSLLETRDGSLWAGTNGGGLIRYQGGKFTTHTMNNGLPHDYIRTLCEARDGSLWIGTNGGGLSRFKGGKFTNYHLSENHVRAIQEDGDGNIWIGWD